MEKSTYTLIHNHPNNTFFSTLDIKVILTYARITTAIVVGNSGKIIYYIVKDIRGKAFGKSIADKLARLEKQKVVSDDNIQRFVDKLKIMGIKYKTYEEV